MGNAFYQGRRVVPAQMTGSDTEVLVMEEGKTQRELDPAPSLKLRNHSPDGFSWGYNGSGPAQLALAILLDVTGDPVVSQSLYQYFKDDFVCHWGESWRVSAHQVREWITNQERR